MWILLEMPSGLSLRLAFGIKHSSDWLWPVSLLPERKRQFSQPSLDPICLDVRKKRMTRRETPLKQVRHQAGGDPYSGKFPGASEGEGICTATAGDGAKDGLIGRSNIKRHFPHF